MHVFHGVQKLQPCLSLSYRSSNFALCPAHGLHMIEKPVQQQQSREELDELFHHILKVSKLGWEIKNEF
ncbi:hypothetical protein U0070_018876 [Myodes glareolus]|uniref:Uncharacterized protein n=1 Tax=Myodes glareolus TaxID=447135 RepID=A0AAW0JUB8_MYOGA